MPRVAVLEEDVLGLEVAVGEPRRVRVGERVGHVPEQPHRRGDRQRPAAREPGPERLAGDARHRVVRHAAGVARRQERDDVRVAEAGGEQHLAPEALDAHHAAQLRREHLDDDRPPERRLRRREDPRHAAAPEPAREAVGDA
jgi:hypothetical protein